MNVCVSLVYWTPRGQAPGSHLLSILCPEARPTITVKRCSGNALRECYSTLKHIFQFPEGFESELSGKMDLDKSYRYLKRRDKRSIISTTESKKELRTRMRNKIIALLVNKYIFLSWIILRMMHIFMLFSSVQATTSLDQAKTDVKSLFIAPWLAISCKIVDGKTWKLKQRN